MSATVIDGRAVAATVRADVAAGVEAFVAETGRRPRLATVLVGDDPASHIYVSRKQRRPRRSASRSDTRLIADTPREELSAVLRGAWAPTRVIGDPAPDPAARTSRSRRDGRPDPGGQGRRRPHRGVAPGGWRRAGPGCGRARHRASSSSSTPTRSPLEGAEAVVLGRSNLFGARSPACCCSATRPSPPAIRARASSARLRPRRRPRRRGRAAAAGAGDWVKPGAAVIDVGINRLEDGRRRRRRLRARRAARGRDHAGARRRRPDDDRLPAAQHPAGRAGGCMTR